MRYSKQIIEYLKIKKIEERTAYRVLMGTHLLKIANVLRVKLSDLFDFQ